MTTLDSDADIKCDYSAYQSDGADHGLLWWLFFLLFPLLLALAGPPSTA